MTIKLKPVHFREVEMARKEKTVFCLNMTKGSYRGQVIIAVPRPNGIGNDSVIVPATFIPVELTTQVSKEQLISSPDFRRAVSSGKITLVDSNDAIQYLETEEAQDELERLRDEQDAIRNTMTATNVEEIHMTGDLAKNEDRAVNMLAASAKGGDDFLQSGRIDGVLASVVNCIEMLKEGADARRTVSSLRNIGELEEADYRYILKNTDDFHYVKDWARMEYNKLKENK